MLERLGKYEILETVAAGGQGTVYRARDSESGDVVALKVMHPGHTGEVQYLEALQQEANLASRLDHPNIVKVLDFQVEDGTAYSVMEYVPDTLDGHIGGGQTLPVATCGGDCHTGGARVTGRPQQRCRPPGHQTPEHTPNRRRHG